MATSQKSAVKSIIGNISKRGESLKSTYHDNLVKRVQSIEAGLDALEQVALSRDPFATEAAHLKRVTDAAKKMEK